MSRELKFADLGEGITEGELVKWLVQEGDTVKEDQPVAEVETDKAIVEIPSPYSAVVEKLHFKPGDAAKVGDVLITFSGDEAATETGAAPTPAKATAAMPPAQRVPSRAKGSLPVLATPHVRKLARDLGIDIDQVKGSGSAGRVSEVDIEKFQEGGTQVPSERLESPHEAGLTVEQFQKWGKIERGPLKGTRRKIAQHMVQARRMIVPVTHIDEADVGALVEIRQQMKEKAAKQGAKLSYLPFIISVSIPGKIRSSASTSVTCAPSLA